MNKIERYSIERDQVLMGDARWFAAQGYWEAAADKFLQAGLEGNREAMDELSEIYSREDSFPWLAEEDRSQRARLCSDAAQTDNPLKEIKRQADANNPVAQWFLARAYEKGWITMGFWIAIAKKAVFLTFKDLLEGLIKTEFLSLQSKVIDSYLNRYRAGFIFPARYLCYGLKPQKLLLKQAADQNYAPAQSSLGELYLEKALSLSSRRFCGSREEWEQEIEELYEKSERCFKAAVKQRFSEAQYNLGAHLIPSRDSILAGSREEVQKIFDGKHEEARKMFEQAADQGFPPAQLRVGYLYLKGALTYENIEKYEKAQKLFIESAKRGNALVLTEVGRMYRYGQIGCLERSSEKAQKMFEHAAIQGNQDARAHLRQMYQSGEIIGCPKDSGEAARMVNLYRDPGSVNVEISQIAVEAHLRNKLGVIRNEEKIESSNDSGIDDEVKSELPPSQPSQPAQTEQDDSIYPPQPSQPVQTEQDDSVSPPKTSHHAPTDSGVDYELPDYLSSSDEPSTDAVMLARLEERLSENEREQISLQEQLAQASRDNYPDTGGKCGVAAGAGSLTA